MTSTFHGGKLIMFGRRPFEHQLFQIIARDFPFLERLFVYNLKEQQVKDRSDEYIIFSHLSELDLVDSHADYAREFLSNENITLPRLTSLSVRYQTLATVNRHAPNTKLLVLMVLVLTLVLVPGEILRPVNGRKRMKTAGNGCRKR
jgi:hypothetical protein